VTAQSFAVNSSEVHSDHEEDSKADNFRVQNQSLPNSHSFGISERS